MSRVMTFAGVLALLVIAVGVAIFAVPLTQYPAEPGNLPQGPAVVTAVKSSTDLGESAAASLVWTPTRTISGVGLSAGVVTAVKVSTGQQLTCGQPVIEVNAVTLPALCGDRPLWRPVKAGMTGPDVDEIVQMLRVDKLLTGAHPSSNELSAAIVRWQAANGSAGTGVIEPGSVIWIGKPLNVAQVSVRVGDLTQPNLAVFTQAPQLQQAKVAPVPSAGLTQQSGRALFNAAGLPTSTAVNSDGSVQDLEAMAKIALASAPTTSDRPPTTVAGAIRLATPITAVAIPASAIVLGGSGDCVLVRSGATTTAARVTVIASQPAAVNVTGEVHAGDQVVTDPGSAATC